MSLADDYALLVDEARRLAKSVPQPVIEVLVGALHDFDADEWITSRNRALHRIAGPSKKHQEGRLDGVVFALNSWTTYSRRLQFRGARPWV